MLTIDKALLLSCLLVTSSARALPSEPPPTPPPAVESSGPSLTGRGARPFRVRLGALAGVVMQKWQFEVGGAWDFLKPHPMWRVVADLTIGMRPTEVSIIPMVGARFVIPVSKAPVEVAVGALAGLNVTVMRGGTALAAPLRFSMGGQYLFRDGMGVGLEASIELGPLIAPFAAAYAAGHVSALFAWGS